MHVVVKSLVSELLDASWIIVADGGTMVEIGKRDIDNRNTLAIEPLDRICSFPAVGFSHVKDITEKRIARLDKYHPSHWIVLVFYHSLFDEQGGHLKPIHPITVFGFEAIPTALSYLRARRHIGEIVIYG